MNMDKWTIGKRITIGFGVVLSLLTLLVIFSGWEMMQAKAIIQHGVQNSLPAYAAFAEIERLVEKNNTLAYQHLFSATPDDMNRIEADIKSNASDIADNADILKGLSLSPAFRNSEKMAEESRLKVVAKREQILATSRNSNSSEETAKLYAETQATLDPLVKEYSKQLLSMAEKEMSYEMAKQMTAMGDINNVWIVMIVLSVVTIGLGIGCTIFITRSTNSCLLRVADQLEKGSQETVSAAGQVSASSQQLAEGASEQAAALEETSSSLEEMSSMTMRNTENADKAKAMAITTRTSADTGSADMQLMSQAMEEIKSSSSQISKIIKTIDEIAFQTNILALNAAVEAARAGEAGAGFAVVADEVRSLAQRAAMAARDTAGMIEEAITKTNRGVDISNKVAQSLNEITARSREMEALVVEIATASSEQSEGVKQISTSVNQMDKVVQNAASNAEETAASAEQLNSQAMMMKQVVAELSALVTEHQGHTGSSYASAPRPASRPSTHYAEQNPRKETMTQALRLQTAMMLQDSKKPNGRPTSKGSSFHDM